MTLRTAQGGRSRNAKRPGALTGIDLAESADCPSMSSGKGSDAHGHGSALGAFATLSAAVVVAYLLPAGEDKKAGHAREPGFAPRATVRVPPLARRLSGAAVGSRARTGARLERHPAPRLPQHFGSSRLCACCRHDVLQPPRDFSRAQQKAAGNRPAAEPKATTVRFAAEAVIPVPRTKQS